MERLIGYILLMLLCLFPLLYISSQEMTQPFLYHELAFAEVSIDKPHIFPIDKTTELGIQFSGQEYRSATATILVILSKVLGISPMAMQFLPIGGLFALIAFYALSKKIFNSYLIASLLTIFMAFGYGWYANSYNIGPSAWAFPFYFLFILLYYKVLNDAQNQNTLKYIILIILIFVSSALFYYHAAAWMISFSILLTLILFIHKKITNNWHPKKDLTLFILPAIFIVTFITFLMFTGMLHNLSQYVVSHGYVSKDISIFISRLVSILIGRHIGTLEPYIFITPNRVFYWSNYSLYGIILIPIGISMLIDIKRVVINRKFEYPDKFTILKWALFFAPIIVMITNLPFGTVDQLLGHATFTFPIILVMCFNKDIRFRRRIFKASILVLILIISLQVANFGFFHTDRGLGYYPISKYEDIKPSAVWFFESSTSNKILSDFYTYSIYLHEASSRETALPLIIYNSARYAMIVNRAESNNLEEITDYIVIDKKSSDYEKAVLGTNWKFYEPLFTYYRKINNNIYINKVYADNTVWIFKTC